MVNSHDLPIVKGVDTIQRSDPNLRANGTTDWLAGSAVGHLEDGTISRVNLTYSDDDGVTWAPPVEVPYLDGAGCTTIAASRDEVYFHWRTAGTPMTSDRMMHLARLGEMSACE